MNLRGSVRLIFLIIAVQLSQRVSAQVGEWVEVTGQLGNYAGNYGELGISHPDNHPPAAYGPMTWTDVYGNFWMLGGVRSGLINSCFWKFDKLSEQWTWIGGSDQPEQPVISSGNPDFHYPGARGYGGCTWVDAQNNLWLFGGIAVMYDGDHESANDLWKYNTYNNRWTSYGGGYSNNGNYGEQGVGTATTRPPSRDETTSCWVGDDGNLWLFGGDGVDGLLNDLWMFDIPTSQWIWMNGADTTNSEGNFGTLGVEAPTNQPPARNSWGHWKDAEGNFWIFSGSGLGNVDSWGDLWKYNPATNMWTWMKGPNTIDDDGDYGTMCVPHEANQPPARLENRACWTDNCGNFWMYGGGRHHPTDFNITPKYDDVWYYNVSENNWTWVSGNAFGGLVGSAPFQSGDELWMYGGQGTGYSSSLQKYEPDPTCTAIELGCPIEISPNAGFFSEETEGCEPFSVQFYNYSTNATNYHWDFGDGSTSTDQMPLHTYATAGEYTTTLIVSEGADADTMIIVDHILVKEVPTADFQLSDNCIFPNQVVEITNTSPNSENGKWSVEGGANNISWIVPINLNLTIEQSWPDTGQYEITQVAFLSGCSDTLIQVVSVLPDVELNVIQEIDTLSASSAENYQWYLNGAPISSATNQTYEIEESGLYHVTTTIGACEFSSDTISVVCSCGVGIDETSWIENISIHPNPAFNDVSIGFVLKEKTDLNISMVDGNGKVVRSKTLKDSFGAVLTQISVDGVASGSYYLILGTPNSQIRSKIIVVSKK